MSSITSALVRRSYAVPVVPVSTSVSRYARLFMWKDPVPDWEIRLNFIAFIRAGLFSRGIPELFLSACAAEPFLMGRFFRVCLVWSGLDWSGFVTVVGGLAAGSVSTRCVLGDHRPAAWSPDGRSGLR